MECRMRWIHTGRWNRFTGLALDHIGCIRFGRPYRDIDEYRKLNTSLNTSDPSRNSLYVPENRHQKSIVLLQNWWVNYFKIPKNIHQNVSLLSIYYPTINPLYTLIICPLFGLSRFSPPGHHAIFDLKAKERSTGGYRQQQLQRLSDEVTRCEWRCRRFP